VEGCSDDVRFPEADGRCASFDDHNFIAGHATMGLEILEDAPTPPRS